MRSNVSFGQIRADTADKDLLNSFLGSGFLGVDFSAVESVRFLGADLVDRGRVFEQDKPKPFGLAEFVQFDCGLFHSAKLFKVFPELCFGRFPRQAIDEKFSVVVLVDSCHDRVLVLGTDPIFSHFSHCVRFCSLSSAGNSTENIGDQERMRKGGNLSCASLGSKIQKESVLQNWLGNMKDPNVSNLTKNREKIAYTINFLSRIELEHGGIITNHLRVFFLQNGKDTMYEAFWLDTWTTSTFFVTRVEHGAAHSLLHGFRWEKVKTKIWLSLE